MLELKILTYKLIGIKVYNRKIASRIQMKYICNRNYSQPVLKPLMKTNEQVKTNIDDNRININILT